MTIADEARDNAIHCEMVKYAYRQSKDGVVVSFVVHPNDIPAALSTSHIGARYVAVLVQVGDDEKPIPLTAKEPRTKTAATPRRLDKPAGAKREKQDWRDVQPAAQAGIRCEDAIFQAFLNEEYPDVWRDCEQDAAAVVRSICKVHSRVEFSTDHRKRVLWHQLDSEYIAWKALEHA